ncbi:hypothetical protein HBI56_187810 [Parastagonospora nodorum]|uniref:Uncharacterized protein n=1 Tax=Phaeosphaeria nodorum (strain SN15 / ATCC MYA-4574 / FGSC 10173) TaxID=321614 RepID=A0A7U2IAN0_PHANO|nr:hypothetical protein HBH56_161720 [Parastagonospora nodorum]QRD06357.1 hypothetical protein JI435_445820 [Parastagonospora nodorum SN15]KAH3932013.1 hypothetical protein HBH54_087530 [Parastagonospora nodorum]KAH3947667.1 hypothetical protein HBH53_114760 [Parastagonospora nodorum]KAH3968917.1 hypothetical protein HBH52_175110 [Parastagonospora nodorum]
MLARFVFDIERSWLVYGPVHRTSAGGHQTPYAARCNQAAAMDHALSSRLRRLCLGLGLELSERTSGCHAAQTAKSRQPRGYVCKCAFDAALVTGPLGLCNLVIRAVELPACALISQGGQATGGMLINLCNATLNAVVVQYQQSNLVDTILATLCLISRDMSRH